ncbi:MAG: hypothetical protein U1E76_22240 [Planctomycetota bacterium]
MSAFHYTAILVAYSCSRCGGTLVHVKPAAVAAPVESDDAATPHHRYLCSRCETAAIEDLLAALGAPAPHARRRPQPRRSCSRPRPTAPGATKGRMLAALFHAHLV